MSFRSTRWFLGMAVGGAMVGAIALGANSAVAQMTPDATLPNNSTVRLDGNTHIIENGTQRGGNLFHSFKEFSVPTGGTAFFNNAADIQNIFSRVTGASVSNIDGLIKANGTANLFLINPNGIVFGPNASLNVGGSFVGTTANAIQFGDRGFFSATNPEAPSPLLTINPSALLFNQIAAGASIQNSSTAPAGLTPSGLNALGLRVPDGKSLLLVGGNISMDGGQLNAYGGRVELGGLAASGFVGLNVDGDKLSLDFPASSTRADISLTNGAAVYVEAGGGGSIGVNARNLDIREGSEVSTGIGQGLGSVDSQAGDVKIDATGAVNVAGSNIFNIVQFGAVGNSGNINIKTGSLSLTNGAQISASTSGMGDSGNITFNALDAVELIGTSADGKFASGIRAAVEPGGQGNAGNLTINTDGGLLIRDSAQISASTFGVGNSGNITFNARDAVELTGTSADGKFASGIRAAVELGGQGNAGSLTINTERLLIRDGAQISASTFGVGNSGNITFNALDAVELIGTSADGKFASGIRAAVEAGGQGNAGNLTIITAGRLLIRDGAQISASTFGVGNSGDIRFYTRDAVELTGTSADGKFASGIRAAVEPGGQGNAGNLTINTDGRLLIRDGAQISASTFGVGNSGNITFNARDAVELTGTSANGQFASGLTSSVERGATGNGGNLNFAANRLEVRDGAQITASNEGTGRPGDIQAEARFIFLNNQGALKAESLSGSGGNISLRASDLVLLKNNSLISAISNGSGDAGNIIIDSGFLIGLEKSNIIANVTNPRFNLIINAQGFLFSPGSEIILNGEKVTDRLPRFLLTVAEPPVVRLANANEIIKTSCAAFDTGGSSFTVTGRGGLPPSPDEPLTNDVIWTDARIPNTTQHSSSKPPIKPHSKPKAESIVIAPATGWVFNGLGEVTLISSAPNTSGLGTTPSTCPGR